MITAIPTRSFLLKQVRTINGTKDIVANRGEKIEISEEEAIKFWGSLDIKEADKVKLMRMHKTPGNVLNTIGRIV